MLLNDNKVHTVLLLMIDRHVGKLVVSLSSIVALLKYFKGKDVHLIIDRSYKEVVESIDGSAGKIYFPRKEIYPSTSLKRIMVFLKFVRDLRRMRPDAVVDLQGGHASSLITLLSGASIRISKSSARRPYVYNRKVDLSVDKHKVRNYTELAAAIGVSVDNPFFRLRGSDHKRNSLNKILEMHGISVSRPVVSVHAGAGNVHKQWTTDGFAEVADWLSSENLQVIFVGADRDLEKIDSIMSRLRCKAFSLGGSLSLGELMALFEMSNLFLGNDSGPMHLAAAMGTPVVGLFGPVDEKRWRPLSPNSLTLRGKQPCDDCREKRRDCGNFPCITTLKPDTVKEAITELLASTTRAQKSNTTKHTKIWDFRVQIVDCRLGNLLVYTQVPPKSEI